ncbi:DUF4272 domain-containing protein [Chitinophaga horti]|uniref:DUF4272 domain-containing protein n=1 Tax=Chitinophaga horti TaxID=2920382 RepID=A0ABY6IZ41_9BACT|nr:DUF4272 domain-containing protein [Chitinophaga horti]UYQ92640.1 DUF4272 domain-containing protein [Chitinophaga horti]
MENYTLYSHKTGFDEIVEKVKAAFPKERPFVGEEDGSQIIILDIKGGFLSLNKRLKISYRQRATPSFNLEEVSCPLSRQLSGMYNYVSSLPATNERVQGLLLQKIKTINSEFSFSVEPKLTSELSKLLADLSHSFDAFIFATTPKGRSQEQQFLDKDMNLVMDTNGKCGDVELKIEIEAAYLDKEVPVTPEIQERKERSEAFLRSRGIKINTWLPYTESESDIVLRSREQVIDRVYALAAITAKAEGVEPARLQNFLDEYEIKNFSPEEQRIINTRDLEDQDAINSMWRYESLNVMLWALGLIKELKYPSEVIDVPAVLDLVLEQSRLSLEGKAQLRSKAEILEELDKIYRMNWACVDARLNGQEPGGHMNPSVVYERHYSLNWLTCYADADWDDVSTDT